MVRPYVIIVDNVDSFTHNIAHALEIAGARCHVMHNDAISAPALLAHKPAGFVLSAGPCTPNEAGVCLSLVRQLLEDETRTPLLGICLGHQTIAMACGAALRPATRPIHGKTIPLRHDGKGCLAALASNPPVVRYNSLVVDEATLPPEIEACGWDEDGDLMALRHRDLPLEGVQFHPESWLGPAGAPLLDGWLAMLQGQRT